MNLSRMGVWLVFSLALMFVAHVVQTTWPGSLAAVSLYKIHLIALAAWAGYWIDRALFPYDRPHEYLEADPADDATSGAQDVVVTLHSAFHSSMLRRALIVAACLIAVGLGA